ncbi:hypothetical protein FHW58_003393 [Duganella sp. 1224]|uniref:hypothetical protein n=1 Tax=Duganella sp. 1224 TaxID=2587052 RepID=UPI0015C95CCE|nr:hypothetical protein [Duganella sp. 1224]NYE62178.1 hypothetical protein [Duganella sp. 1224]
MKREIVNLTRLAGLSAACMLASCASAPAPATQTVQVPVAVPCVKAAPARPAFEFDQLPATASDGDKVLALVRDWARYRKYTGELEAVIAGCR